MVEKLPVNRRSIKENEWVEVEKIEETEKEISTHPKYRKKTTVKKVRLP